MHLQYKHQTIAAYSCRSCPVGSAVASGNTIVCSRCYNQVTRLYDGWCAEIRAGWLHSDKNDLTEETLLKQYQLVKRRTSNNFTYNMGSHVLQFGSLSIDEEPVADYLGDLNTGMPTTYVLCSSQRCLPRLHR